MGEQKVYLPLDNGLKGDNFHVLIPCARPYQFRSNTKSEHNTLLCPLLPPFQNGEKHCNKKNFKNYIRFDWKYSIAISIHSKYIDMFQYFSDILHMYVYGK